MLNKPIFIHSFFHSFTPSSSKYLLSTCYVPGSVLEGMFRCAQVLKYQPFWEVNCFISALCLLHGLYLKKVLED